MRGRATLWCFLAVLCLTAGPAEPANAWLGRAILRGGVKSVTRRAVEKSIASLLRRDLARDATSQIKLLPAPRTVFRYTTQAQARRELARGIAPGRHMTSHARPGRPLRAARAKERYGLPQEPEVRETVRLPAGQPVRVNRVVGGEPGRAELTSPSWVPPTAIKKVVPLR
jgi:hypothetical protein